MCVCIYVCVCVCVCVCVQLAEYDMVLINAETIQQKHIRPLYEVRHHENIQWPSSPCDVKSDLSSAW